ncbi:MAG: methylmalonyl-CoA mutase, partial [Chloroflexi bacterium]|nr:methylmalonyl-CoA mutase [Chloroflexota bacterium]
EDEQVARLKEIKQTRDKSTHQAALDQLRNDAKASKNVMPALIAAAEADATVGELMDLMADVFGRYGGGPEW